MFVFTQPVWFPPFPKTVDPSVACRPSHHVMVMSEWRLLNALRFGTKLCTRAPAVRAAFPLLPAEPSAAATVRATRSHNFFTQCTLGFGVRVIRPILPNGVECKMGYGGQIPFKS